MVEEGKTMDEADQAKIKEGEALVKRNRQLAMKIQEEVRNRL